MVPITHSSSSLAGETFCGIAVLKLLGRLPSPIHSKETSFQDPILGSDFIEKVTRWLVYRQTVHLYEDDDEEEEEDKDEIDEEPNGMAFTPGFQVRGSHPAKLVHPQPALAQPTSIEAPPEKLFWAGFNGRFNKVADTCYSWWVGASLGMLDRPHLQNFDAAERYLLDKTQHQIGGFCKMPGDPPG